MSWVAEKNAISQNAASVPAKKALVGSRNATDAMQMPISSCIVMVHQRFVRIRSTNGLQKGLITHGRYSQPV